MMSARSRIAWTTRGHTGEDVSLYHYGYAVPLGLIENTEIARMAAEALGVDLTKTADRLFAPAHEVFGSPGTSLSVERSGTGAAALVVRKGKVHAEFPLGTNLMRVVPPGRTYEMEGISVPVPGTDKVYLPRQAAVLLEEAARP